VRNRSYAPKNASPIVATQVFDQFQGMRKQRMHFYLNKNTALVIGFLLTDVVLLV